VRSSTRHTTDVPVALRHTCKFLARDPPKWSGYRDPVAFSGFPPAALAFYERLEADNTKVFWEANKATYRAEVRDTMQALCDELAEQGPFHLFRPHNDLRFSKNKPPYKTHQGAYGEREGGAGFYVQLSKDGLMVAAGYYAMMRDQLERFRDAVAAEHTGAELERLVAALPRQHRIGAIDELKTAPKGYPKDHPRIAFLRRKGLMTMVEFGTPAWLRTARVTAKVRDVWNAAEPMNAWLDAHVGPSTLEPDGRFGR
jgi:uncharacterized protein (TIGR02453 family)